MSTKPETSSEKPKRKYTRKVEPYNYEEIPKTFETFRSADSGSALPEGVNLSSRFKYPEPQKDIAAGDKTPSYVEWFRDNHTAEEFDAKYGHRKLGEIE